MPPPVPFFPVLPPGMPQLVSGMIIPMVLLATEPPEEINEVAIDVEHEEDEGGTVGDTFTDYRPPKLSLGLPHPDPVVETSLSGVQHPEPTYNLNIMDGLDDTKVAIDVEREEDEGGTVGETFTDYRPPKLSLGLPHPDPVVETSLSGVQPPKPTYNLNIMDELDDTKWYLYHLPTGDRAGFFIGDGAGVDNGRTIAGLIWENWQQGKHKAVCVFVGSDLKNDTQRDLDDVVAKCVSNS